MRTLALVLALSACGQERPAEPPPGTPLEVKGAKPPLEGFAKHERLVLAGPPAELADRTKAALEKADPAPLKASDDVHLYLLFGWSGNGLDDVRRTRVEVWLDRASRTFTARIRSARTLDASDFAGITDMQYVGFGARAGPLAPGDYTVKVLETVTTYKTPRDPAPVTGQEKLLETRSFTVR